MISRQLKLVIQDHWLRKTLLRRLKTAQFPWLSCVTVALQWSQLRTQCTQVKIDRLAFPCQVSQGFHLWKPKAKDLTWYLRQTWFPKRLFRTRILGLVCSRQPLWSLTRWRIKRGWLWVSWPLRPRTRNSKTIPTKASRTSSVRSSPRLRKLTMRKWPFSTPKRSWKWV